MKKILYNLLVFLIFVAIWFGSSIILALIFRSNYIYPFAYDIGRWCVAPYIIFLSLGLALLFRRPLYHKLIQKDKQISNFAANMFLWAGCVWAVGVIIINIVTM